MATPPQPSTSAQQTQGMTQPAFTDLPPEILVKISMIFLERVDVKTILIIRAVCRQFRAAIDGSPLMLKAFEIYKSIKSPQPNIGEFLKNIETKIPGGEFMLPSSMRLSLIRDLFIKTPRFEGDGIKALVEESDLNKVEILKLAATLTNAHLLKVMAGSWATPNDPPLLVVCFRVINILEPELQASAVVLPETSIRALPEEEQTLVALLIARLCPLILQKNFNLFSGLEVINKLRVSRIIVDSILEDSLEPSVPNEHTLRTWLALEAYKDKVRFNTSLELHSQELPLKSPFSFLQGELKSLRAAIDCFHDLPFISKEDYLATVKGFARKAPISTMIFFENFQLTDNDNITDLVEKTKGFLNDLYAQLNSPEGLKDVAHITGGHFIYNGHYKTAITSIKNYLELGKSANWQFVINAIEANDRLISLCESVDHNIEAFKTEVNGLTSNSVKIRSIHQVTEQSEHHVLGKKQSDRSSEKMRHRTTKSLSF